ncbi:hypothetical protein [Streptomyces pristinaespiralis]|uniref:hypothetical protein n=1 Tax=Streptomyces pristinaespiralis TaxID=38300 RepID=UPI00340E5C66
MTGGRGDDNPDVTVKGSSWYQRVNAHVAHLQGQLNKFEERRKSGGRISPDDARTVATANAHLEAARNTLRDCSRWQRLLGASADRALANVHEAEVALLRIAPESELHDKGLYALSHAKLHLMHDDVLLQQLSAALNSPPRKIFGYSRQPKPLDSRGRELAALTLHAAYQAEEAERARVRSFTQIVVMAAGALWLIAVSLGIWGALAPDVAERVCFTNMEGTQGEGSMTRVCPLGETPKAANIFFLEFIGLFAAAVAGAVSLKGVRGTSGPYHVATGLIILRLPVGALTAVAGILLMSGEFLPGLTNLDTATQVCAWAFAFGVLQESVTRAVDRQGQHLIDNVKAPGSNVGDAEKEKEEKRARAPGPASR